MMKYRLPRVAFDPLLNKLVSREERKQQAASKMGKKALQELSDICKAVKKTGLPEHLVCKNLSKHLGSGIFLHPKAKPLKKGQIIGPYSGVLNVAPQNAPGDSSYVFSLMCDMHLKKEEQKILDKKASYRPNRLYAIDIEAENTGNFIRFVNHSDKPNVEAELFSVPKNTLGLTPSPIEVFYVAKKTIHPGEQLLICYEAGDNSYWTNLDIEPTPMIPKTFKLSSDLRVTKD